MTPSPQTCKPYEGSLCGEYARMLLFLVLLPLLLVFSDDVFAFRSRGALCFAAAAVLLAALITSRGHPGIRITLLVAMLVNVLMIAINPLEDFGFQQGAASEFSVYLLSACLAIASAFEVGAWLKSSSRVEISKTLGWLILLTPALIYAVVIPLIQSAWLQIENDPNKLAMQDPRWSVVSEMAFRSAKFLIFGLFAYLGACLGSFLNVVAYCVPRGEAVGLRSSACPKCHAKISRKDNLPIFSYVNLGARCRSCGTEIPVRYLIVELVVMSIFGSLFLYELVTGCRNIPFVNIQHHGILWIILYPKWPAIAIYFFHCCLMSAVFLLALIEWDQQPLKRYFAAIVTAGFVASAMVYPPVQPVPLLAHLPVNAVELSVIVEQLAKLAAGGSIGALLGWSAIRLTFSRVPTILVFSFFLAGIVLGWQALLQVLIVFTAVVFVARLWPATRNLFHGRPTTLFLVAIAAHHPFWKLIADCWRFD